jgi:glucose/arabinose dehydrogenase
VKTQAHSSNIAARPSLEGAVFERNAEMKSFSRCLLVLVVFSFVLIPVLRRNSAAEKTGISTAADTGGSPFTDFRGEAPGTIHKITPGDLPKPYMTPDSDNDPRVVAKPGNAWPQALPGFKVDLYAGDLKNPRLIRTAPNGDLFLAESDPGIILVFRGVTSDGKAAKKETFATGLSRPFGITFYPPGPNPQYVYIGNTDSVVRFPYQNGDLKARGPQETIIPSLPSGNERVGGGGHWTRDIAFSLDGKQMFVSVGSRTNIADVDEDKTEFHRANILVANPDGSNLRVYASGIRNPVGIAVDPKTGVVWTSVNERDRIGDNLPPDYITHVQEGGFYGWPWYYTGGNEDPRLKGKHPELKDKVIVPDVLLEPHNASLELTFYEGSQFPAEYAGDIFAAEHGSWNRSVRTGYEVILVPLRNGRASGEYEDFLTGFVTADGKVWGRPVGVAVAQDGSLMVTDDGSGSLWRVSYASK